jgi:lysyl-tRNA synthetase class 1
MKNEAMHWADLIARRIIAEKGDKESYTLASGITPSGTIHIGKFREIITTEMVSRALARMGKKTRFIYSWDDYDTFRKVPADMPGQEMLKGLLYQPIVDIPDVYGTEESYARHNEATLEKIAPDLGISNIEFIYQSKMYRGGAYNDLIVEVADKNKKVRDILQKFKTNEIDAGWFPIETYCGECNRDRGVKFSNYDSDSKTIDCECELCGHRETLNLRESRRLKLPWRVDWPMRWKFENVDFEPGGTDHSSAGGSFDTSRIIVREIFGGSAPVYAKYAFVLPKGEKRKMSSSVGNGFSVDNVLDVYTPEMVRWFFASYKPDAPFNMAFDIDVLKNYENFDRMERAVYGGEPNEEKRAALRRIYEMSQINFDGKIPESCPFRPVFRHLCNYLQSNGLDIEKTRAVFADQIKNDADELRYRERAKRAVFWLENYAPDDFIFRVNAARRTDVPMTDAESAFVAGVRDVLQNDIGERDLQDKIGALIESNGLDAQAAYRVLYQLLIGRDKGPKLAGFMLGIGRDKVLELL